MRFVADDLKRLIACPSPNLLSQAVDIARLARPGSICAEVWAALQGC
jgi:hypothetical protein